MSSSEQTNLSNKYMSCIQAIILNDPPKMMHHLTEGGGFGGINMYIDVPKDAKGVYIGDLSAAPDEREFLLQCGTSFEVDRIEISKDQFGDPKYKVYMKVKVN